jgi:hypothetical protein
MHVANSTPYRIAVLAILGVAAALAVVVFAGGGSSLAQVRSATSRAVADDPLSVHISSPSPDAQVSAPFELQLQSNVALGPPETGLHHVHLYYDTTTPDGPYDLVYGSTAQVTGLTPGVHTVLASLRNPNHNDAGPSEIISVTVVGSTDGAADSAAMQRSVPMDDMSMPATPQPETVPNYGY